MKYSLQREPKDILGTSYRPAINRACLKTAFLKLYKDIFLLIFPLEYLIKKRCYYVKILILLFAIFTKEF